MNPHTPLNTVQMDNGSTITFTDDGGEQFQSMPAPVDYLDVIEENYFDNEEVIDCETDTGEDTNVDDWS